MSPAPRPGSERLLDLLTDRALGELSPVDAPELERLLREHPEIDPDTMDFTAADAAAAMCPASDDPIPSALRDRLLADARSHRAQRPMAVAPGAAKRESPRGSGASWFPWLLAAASIVIAASVWIGSRPAPAPGIEEQYRAFATTSPPADLVRIAWSGQPDPLVTDSLSGEIVWSQSQQKGYMKFSGLRANDPTREQYQLWIFDGSREHPVDGGVFDIDDEGNAIVPIDAKLAVRQPTLFAVTVEKPGGVVVSGKERIAVVAPVEQG